MTKPQAALVAILALPPLLAFAGCPLLAVCQKAAMEANFGAAEESFRQKLGHEGLIGATAPQVMAYLDRSEASHTLYDHEQKVVVVRTPAVSDAPVGCDEWRSEFVFQFDPSNRLQYYYSKRILSDAW